MRVTVIRNDDPGHTGWQGEMDPNASDGTWVQFDESLPDAIASFMEESNEITYDIRSTDDNGTLRMGLAVLQIQDRWVQFGQW
ncbi:hypothetical protein OG331_49325 [Streptomyces sp. NBC_01017]|uniref:hypothetical protein n=1 Tax=Streptomyces sp. NBC_01017 TaxID=2903721 RepID=UPI00386C1499|nr:hypothetical protein OG331_02650 [Streptomyces sp. NBC_01017]WSV35005.1 hypothetical protein OG331_49325 [Streptomyces sp. NBC_01017]